MNHNQRVKKNTLEMKRNINNGSYGYWLFLCITSTWWS